jgi:large-conductance mechanosensitive channel
MSTEFIKSTIDDASFEEASKLAAKQNRMVLFKGLLTIILTAGVFIGIFLLLQYRIQKNKDVLKKTNLRTFFVKTGIIKVALGFFISTQVLLFINEIINVTAGPLIAYILGRKTSIKDLRASVFGVTFQFGNLVIASIRLMFVLLFVYLIYFLITVNGFDIYAS